MSLAIVARRYAQALVELGAEQGDLDKLVAELGTVAEAWETSSELRGTLENPVVPHTVKKAVMGELAEQIGATATTRHTLLLLVDRRRTRLLPYLARSLNELADARKGLVRAEVTTAVTLSEGYYARLQAQLERMTGKRVVLERRTDPALVGGVVARIGDRVLDGSVRTRLEALRDALMPGA